MPYAIGSAAFASLTSILGKIGISGVESNLGTAIRTGVVLVMAWIMVLATGKPGAVRNIPPGNWPGSACPGLPPALPGCAIIAPCRAGLPALWCPSTS